MSIDNEKGLVDTGVYVKPEESSYTVTEEEDYRGIRFKAIAEGNPNIHFASPAYTKANLEGYMFADTVDSVTTNLIMTLIEPGVTVGTIVAETYTVTFVDYDETVLKTEEVTADEGYEIEDVKVDGKSVGAVSSYEFKRVKADHTISATFKKIEVIEPEEDKKYDFTNVPEDKWYYESVMKACNKGWFSGTSDTTFSPNLAMNRGMIVTVLWRMGNEPVSNANSFADVITVREFLDYQDISEYALPPLVWAVNTGLIQGANNKLVPKDSATRAQVATILVGFSETIVK